MMCDCDLQMLMCSILLLEALQPHIAEVTVQQGPVGSPNQQLAQKQRALRPDPLHWLQMPMCRRTLLRSWRWSGWPVQADPSSIMEHSSSIPAEPRGDLKVTGSIHC